VHGLLRGGWLVLFVVVLLVVPVSAHARLTCDLGEPITERALLLPRPGTFYSVDALGPDVVRWRGRVLMYFSGNDLHTGHGQWHTGLAVASSPLGPFRVLPHVRLPYLNGGTVAWRGRLWQATMRTQDWGQSVLRVSGDGVRWRTVLALPRVSGPFRLLASPSLAVINGRLRVWMLARYRPGLNSVLVTFDLRGSRWVRRRLHLRPGRFAWSQADLGEPSLFRWQGHYGLLYVGMAATTYARAVGLAVPSRAGKWRACGPGPLIGASESPWGGGVSIDPAALPIGRRLYVYYGAGPGLSVAADLGGGIGVRVYQQH
jgi:hypothetical protein